METKYMYKDEFGNECIFLRDAYYELVCAIITDFFEETLPNNDFHSRFLNLLNTLEGYDDVYNITTEMPFYWAICIIENEWTNKHLIKNKTNDLFIEWYKKYKQKNDIVSFIIEGINEDTYIFNDKEGGKNIFLRGKYYEFISDLIKYFFNKTHEYNELDYMLIGYLNGLPASGNDKNIEKFINKELYWALSIIENKETTTVLNEKQLEEYNKFRDEFFETNNITSFIVSQS
ncbi:hypothetical protein HNP24_001893 [Chryseobacterium sediminis]|uniref:Uncharacterized protein n=1 Tax=Chryseobacterium sediminis TaxID=1679494 RepID=A0ABR6PZ39_9FLAO|nr:hypothetical protein [Chryseobacterium sediminis]MBB6330943.1 hypothetical protein [Chryseobacterium sediminis]